MIYVRVVLNPAIFMGSILEPQGWFDSDVTSSPGAQRFAEATINIDVLLGVVSVALNGWDVQPPNKCLAFSKDRCGGIGYCRLSFL